MMTLRQLMARFPTNNDCKQYLQDRRWPKGAIKCPRCGNDKVYGSKARPFTWQCKQCGKNPRSPYRFSVLVGTVFENTNYPLKTWFEVLWAMLNSKKGISAMQIQRQIGCGAYHTAWYMCMRLRAGMQDKDFRELLGIVEVDETYVGGKDKNRHKGKRSSDLRASGKAKGFAKVGVIGAIARKGSVICRVIGSADARTLAGFVDDVVGEKVELVATDENHAYNYVRVGMPHESVNHSAGEYVRGIVHTGTIDGFWSLLKRGIMGSFHHVSKKYLPLYLNEFSYRYNNRDNPDIFGTAVAAC